jgi:CheY-like chemotaxis protein
MLRILVVEDDAAVRGLLDLLLTSDGHVVQTARNSQEATAFMLYDIPHVPDLAILDIVLPGMSGVEYADDLRRRFPSIRLLFMTGWQENSAQQEKARRLGPILEKPFDRLTLQDAIKGVVQTEAAH